MYLPMLVDADLTQQSFTIGGFIHGRDTDFDFDQNWFVRTGDVIVKTMITNTVMPMATYVGMYGMRLAKIGLDTGFTFDPKITKKVTRQAYIDLYAGPEYALHYKYSYILKITFTTMMYGVGMPILFPIAMVSLIIFYITEKHSLYYDVREPPQYDDKLNASTLQMLSYSPYFLLAFGYWMLSNKQLISNDFLYPRNMLADKYETSHYWYVEVWLPYSVNWFEPASAVLLFLFAILVYRNLSFLPGISYISQKTGFKAGNIEDEHFDEQIDLYQNCLDDDDRNWTCKEEENSRHALNTKTMLDQSLQKVRFSQIGRCHLQGIHTYDILRNPKYVKAFQYVSPSIENREQFIKDGDDDDDNNAAQSDLVKNVLSLAYRHDLNDLLAVINDEDMTAKQAWFTQSMIQPDKSVSLRYTE